MKKQPIPNSQSAILPNSFHLAEGNSGVVIPFRFNDVFSLELKGSIPSKKNKKQIIFSAKRNRHFIISSNIHQSWHSEASQAIHKLAQKPFNLKDIQLIIFTCYPATMRKYDLSNKWESVADLLVDTKILEDDNAYVIGKVLMLHGIKDSENPRCEIQMFF